MHESKQYSCVHCAVGQLFWGAVCPLCSFWRSPVALYFIPAQRNGIIMTNAFFLQVQMGNLNFLLGRVQYDTESQLTFPLEAQIGLGVGASFVALIVLVIVFIYR